MIDSQRTPALIVIALGISGLLSVASMLLTVSTKNRLRAEFSQALAQHADEERAAKHGQDRKIEDLSAHLDKAVKRIDSGTSPPKDEELAKLENELYKNIQDVLFAQQRNPRAEPTRSDVERMNSLLFRQMQIREKIRSHKDEQSNAATHPD